MEELNKKIRITHRINDSSLDINNLSQYGLFLSIEDKNLRVVVIDEVQKKCMLLEDYRFSGVPTRKETVAQLNSIYENHLILRAGYWKQVVFITRTGAYVNIPDAFFDEKQLGTYLGFATANIENGVVRSFYNKKTQSHRVFQVEQEFLHWLKQAYPSKEPKVMHQSDAFLAGALASYTHTEEAEVFVCIENKYMGLVILQGDKILLENRYYYQSPQDFVYFVLFAIDELQLNPDTCKVHLYGEISKDSGIFNLIYKYIRNVDFGKKPSAITFSYVFDEVLEHRYFDLYNAYLSVSSA
jgi:hypothetical protein